MAYIRRLPTRADGSKGKWQATVRHPSGKKITKTDKLKGVVEKWAEEQERAFRHGEVPQLADRRLTVRAWEAKWTKSRNVEKNTAAKNKSHMANYVLPRWGDWPLHSIGRIDVATWVKDMTAAGAGPDTVHAAYNLFSKMLADAVLEQKLGASPCREIDLPKVVKPAPRWFTRHEYDRIQLALGNRTLQVAGGRGGREIPDPMRLTWQAFVALGCFSGLRPGELAGLDVPALDFDRRMVYVSQVVTRHGLKPYGKTTASTRWVPFPDEVAELLWRLVADRPEGPVFTSPRGERVSESSFRNRVWRPALEAAGVPYEDPYTMRHCCATWLIQKGVPDYEIAQMLGHTSTRMLSVYAHLEPGQHDRIRAAWGSGEQFSWRTGGATAPVGEAVEL